MLWGLVLAGFGVACITIGVVGTLLHRRARERTVCLLCGKVPWRCRCGDGDRFREAQRLSGEFRRLE